MSSTSKKRFQPCENVNILKILKRSADDDEEKLLELERSDRKKNKSDKNQRQYAKKVAGAKTNDDSETVEKTREKKVTKKIKGIPLKRYSHSLNKEKWYR